jgi:hypothetical protein
MISIFVVHEGKKHPRPQDQLWRTLVGQYAARANWVKGARLVNSDAEKAVALRPCRVVGAAFNFAAKAVSEI